MGHHFWSFLHGNKNLKGYSLMLRSDFVDPFREYIWWVDGYYDHHYKKKIEHSKVAFFQGAKNPKWAI